MYILSGFNIKKGFSQISQKRAQIPQMFPERFLFLRNQSSFLRILREINY